MITVQNDWRNEMSENKNSAVNKYRKKHKRCKTCAFASQSNWGWNCLAKGQRYSGSVSDTKLSGLFCRLYEAKEFKL